ncbi:uncharacterized protein CTRU02_201386 [Colletotrichum truncatum]|uniref:Uncharacterized protein n=1 Tax=Colletotrichum truncatum TaxID=5467 RepID=A0ACC3ZH51_COLTU|nr:uncharacterized protein CTRU02_08176 [Colletotrichum truncatum]KAF6790656.1 hypothetical protein CTRU02_08176 [Colletotrichum truncatum]
MQFNIVAALVVLSAIQPIAARFCTAAAIQCYYDSGKRCASWCFPSNCGCSENKEGYGKLTKSGCITAPQFWGRNKC